MKYPSVSVARLLETSAEVETVSSEGEPRGDSGNSGASEGRAGAGDERGGEREGGRPTAPVPTRSTTRRGGVSAPRRATPPIMTVPTGREEAAEGGWGPREEEGKAPAPDGLVPRTVAAETGAAEATTVPVPPAEALVVPWAQPAGTAQPWIGVLGEREEPAMGEKEWEPINSRGEPSRWYGPGRTTLDLRPGLLSSESEPEKALEWERLMEDRAEDDDRGEQKREEEEEERKRERGEWAAATKTNSQKHEEEEDGG